MSDEVDAGVRIAAALDLTPRRFYEASDGSSYYCEGALDVPEGWLGGMLLKVLRDETPTAQRGRPYAAEEVNFFWQAAQQLPIDLDPTLRTVLESRQPSHALWEAVRNWAGRRSVFTVTGRLRANASFCASRNCLFQGAAADGAILALWALWRRGYKVVASIHDQNVIEVPADEAVLPCKQEIEHLMIEGMRTIVPGMNVRVESVITRSLNKADIDERFVEAGARAALRRLALQRP